MDILLSNLSAAAIRDNRAALTVLFGTLILMLPIAINGGAIVYFDSAAYVEQIAKGINAVLSSLNSAPTLRTIPNEVSATSPGGGGFGTPQGDKIVIAGRSAYYGALAYLGWKTSMWLPVAVQCLAMSWLVVSLFWHVAKDVWGIASLATLLVLAVLTPAAFFAGLIMPDIWAGLMVLALALFWSCGSQLTRTSKLAIFAIIAFAVLVHKSHLALLCVLCAGYAAVYLVKRKDTLVVRRMLAIPLLALGCGIVGHMAFSLAVREIYGVAPISRPHITAHLVDLGPGTDFARESCPESGLAICAFVDRLPTDWIQFLFSRDAESGVFAVSSPDVMQTLSEEQAQFALGTLATRPVETVAGLLRDGVAQLWTLSVADVPLTLENAAFLESRFPQSLVHMTQGTVFYNNPEKAEMVTRVTQVTTALSTVLLLGLLCLRVGETRLRNEGDADTEDALWTIVAICVAGVVANALICGILASPYGRFQARIVWILPFLAGLILAARHVAVPARHGLFATTK